MRHALAVGTVFLAFACDGRSPSNPAPEPAAPQVDAKDPTKPEKSATEDNRDGRQKATSLEQDGMRLTVWVPKVTTAGSPLPIDVTVVNRRKAPVVIYWDTTEPMMVEVTLTAQDGKAVPFTQYGRKKIAPTELVDQLKNRLQIPFPIKLRCAQSIAKNVQNRNDKPIIFMN